jgi:ATP-binding cassette subfamily B protein
MPHLKKIDTLLMRLWLHLAPQRRHQFFLLFTLMILASFAEMLSIGAVFPFLSALTSPSAIFESAYAQPFIRILSITEPDQILFPLTIIFGVATLIAGAMRVFLLWVSMQFSFSAGADLSTTIYRLTLYQPYSIQVLRNSSEVISGIYRKTDIVIYGVLMPILTLISSAMLIAAVLIALFTINAVVTIIAFGGFSLIYILIIATTRNKIALNDKEISRETTQVIKALQEGLGGIRDVLIDGTQEAYCAIYKKSDLPLRRAQMSNQFIGSSPRFGMEVLGMLLISALAYMLARQSDGIEKAVPILGALAIGAQRLLPILQQMYSSWTSIQGSQESLRDILDLLDQPLPNYLKTPTTKKLIFENKITLKNLGFKYGTENPWVLRQINLSIDKGSRIGFIGVTGSGKTTLLDIVMGLLQPVEGEILIDGQVLTTFNQRSWQSNIAHVPQSIFLTDSTIEENIAFGIPRKLIDHQRVLQAAQQAQIAETIESWPLKYETLVGERGVKLSGGQRQRIGIARALYKQAQVIIFDEATSALDNETEQIVMDAINHLGENLTILIIAHRLSTLKDCKKIVKLNQGGIMSINSYEDIIKPYSKITN